MHLGGEDFIVIAPNTDGVAAMLLAEGIRRTIEKNQLKNLGLPKLLTASIGVADLTHKQQNGKELIIKDDEALYRHSAVQLLKNMIIFT